MTWIKKKTGSGLNNITTLEDAECIWTFESKVVLGYLNSLVVCLFQCLNYFDFVFARFDWLITCTYLIVLCKFGKITA